LKEPRIIEPPRACEKKEGHEQERQNHSAPQNEMVLGGYCPQESPVKHQKALKDPI